MKIDQKNFEEYLEKNFIFENYPQISVAVSGGPDSMCLLFLLKEWIKKRKGFLVALIINHQLRADSNIEANFVRDYLTENKIFSKIIRINNKKIIKKTMSEARKNRFDCLINYCKNNKILHLFLGHHFDDNLETFLIRKIAGSNFEGLSSIKNKVFKSELQIIRPLIDINKKNILAFNKINNIKFVSDPSNKNLNYTRTIVRNFLNDEKFYISEIKKDFKLTCENYAIFMSMIYQSFHELLINISKKSIFIDKKIFFLRDNLIQAKIIEIIYKYLKSSRIPLRYKKIIVSLDKIKKNTTSKTNLAGLMIISDNLMIKFIS